MLQQHVAQCHQRVRICGVAVTKCVVVDACGVAHEGHCILDATGAQIFTPAEARFVGLEGIPDDPEGRERVLIAFRPADEQYIASRLEAHPAVATFKLHDLG